MSNIGGTLGLWLGFSLMTTFEFLEFLVDLLVYAIEKRRNRQVGPSPPPTRCISNNDVTLEDVGNEQENSEGVINSPPPPYTSQPDVGEIVTGQQ